MEECLAIIGGILLASTIFLFGTIVGRDDAEQKCSRGDPVVIKAKVYRCIESK